MKSKINYPEFITFIKQHDIIGVQESKLDDVDKISIEGYQIFTHNRKKISNHRSGGIALIVKEELADKIKILESSSKLILWFKLTISLRNNNDDITCGIVYIPPIRTKYANPDPYLELQREINKYGTEKLLLFGDFNSRVGTKADYVEIDEFISQINGNDYLSDENKHIINKLTQLGIPLERKYEDKTTNEYGNMLLEFCSSNDLFILNGRIGSDFTQTKTTCMGKSTIDYFISSVNTLYHIKNLEVYGYESLYSDVHNPIVLTVETKQRKNKNCTKSKPDTNGDIIKWKDSRKHLFLSNFDADQVSNAVEELDKLIADQDKNPKDIDKVVEEINKTFETCCEKTFGKYVHNNTDKQKTCIKPWFNHDCRRIRNQYHMARKLYNKNKNDRNRNELKKISKEYKKSISIAVKQHKDKKIWDLKQCKKGDPKTFWKIINSIDKEKKDIQANLNDLYEFFKKVNNNEENNNSPEVNPEELESINIVNEDINRRITEEEILNSIRNLKNNKSAGIDNILNEHIKATKDIMLPFYVKLFNLVLDEGIIPTVWTEGNILPIYKNKGDPTLPQNYRPITLLSCLGKLFTAIISNRLNKYMEESNTIGSSQAGFRNNQSTVDNLFILQSLVELLHSQKKKLFCAFIDFKQAFDTVWRSGLWSKLLKYNINGKCLKLIKNMYADIKSRIKTNEGATLFFPSTSGVRQGENLSPLLFSLYLNDLEEFLVCKNANGVECNAYSDDIYMYIQLFIILYADDTVLMSTNAKDLQQSLGIFQEYCNKWKLTVNIDKTKVVIFGSKCRTYKNQFQYGEKIIEIVNEYKYLGIFLSRTGSYIKTKKHIAAQANKAMFSLLRKTRILNLPLETQIELFNKTIKPILLYASEIWGIGNVESLERVQLKFFKLILNLKKSTPSHMIYGELGILPLEIDIKNRLISFWLKISDPEVDKLSSSIYSIIYTHHEAGKMKSKWIAYIKETIAKNGFGYIWEQQRDNLINRKWFRLAFKQRIRDQYLQSWNEIIDQSSGSTSYKIFKINFEMNKYFHILPNRLCQILTAFRTRNHRLPIETGRWRSIPRNDRKCQMCNLKDLGDEFHYVLKCPNFNEDRKKYIKKYYFKNPNVIKFCELLNVDNEQELAKLVKFLSIIMKEATLDS